MSFQLSCNNLTLGYEGRIIVENLSFKVAAKDYLCIVGENGAGKSTILKAILNLKSPMVGQIVFDESLAPYTIGYLPQQTPQQKDFPASVREVVRSGLLGHSTIRPFYSVQEKQIAKANMKRLGILTLEKHSYGALSGGQQQRVLLARALSATGKMLLLDEATAGLDPQVTNELYLILKKLNEEGITIISITHDIPAAINYASHILHIGNGRLLFFGTTKEYILSKVGSDYIAKVGKLE